MKGPHRIGHAVEIFDQELSLGCQLTLPLPDEGFRCREVCEEEAGIDHVGGRTGEGNVGDVVCHELSCRDSGSGDGNEALG